jgi:hypothetical protein
MLRIQKIELKREWWSLDSDEGQTEFIKDVTAMANTNGRDGFILIGIDGKTGDIKDSLFPSVGKINDPSKLGQLIHKKVQEPFDIEYFNYLIEGVNIGVLYIPYSKNKPHVIKLHKNIQNFIPVRKSTSINAANKYDLDLMYNERDKVVTPPYSLKSQLINPTRLNQNISAGTEFWSCTVNIINSGANINMVVKARLEILRDNEIVAVLEHSRYFLPNQSSDWVKTSDNNFITVKPNSILRVNMGFNSNMKSFQSITQEEFRYFLLDGSLQGRLILEDIMEYEYMSPIFTLKKM